MIEAYDVQQSVRGGYVIINSNGRANVSDYFLENGKWYYYYGKEKMEISQPHHLEALTKYLRKQKLEKLLK